MPGTYLYDFIMYRRFRTANLRDADARKIHAPTRYHRRIRLLNYPMAPLRLSHDLLLSRAASLVQLPQPGSDLLYGPDWTRPNGSEGHKGNRSDRRQGPSGGTGNQGNTGPGGVTGPAGSATNTGATGPNSLAPQVYLVFLVRQLTLVQPARQEIQDHLARARQDRPPRSFHREFSLFRQDHRLLLNPVPHLEMHGLGKKSCWALTPVYT